MTTRPDQRARSPRGGQSQSIGVPAAARARRLPLGRDVVEGDPGQPVALGLRGALPDALSQADGAADRAATIGLHVADDEDDDRIVGEDVAQIGQDVAQEGQVGLAVMRVVERRIDRPRVEAEEPRAEPVVVAVLHDPQVRR
jgi:hypothetical protein